ncbi:MAG: hypothetical protein ACRCUR_03505 [Cetobacterium sp.]
MFKYICIFITIFQLTYSGIISEEGRGKSEEIAKNNALENLSKSLKVNIDVEEELVTVQKGDKKESTTYKNKFKLKSELTILGVKYRVLEKNKEGYVVQAYLDEDALKEHTSQLQKEKSEIVKSLESFSEAKSFDSQKDSLKQALKSLENFEKLAVVYDALNKDKPKMDLGEMTVNINHVFRKIRLNRSSLQSLESEIENLLKNNFVAIVVEEDKGKLDGLTYEYVQYLKDIKKESKLGEREKASKLIKIKVIEEGSRFGFKYFTVNLKTGTENEFLKSKKDYESMDFGFVEDLLENIDVINKKIGELSNGK